jgi:hypothetical protein
MIVRKLAIRGSARAGSEHQRTNRNRIWLFTWLTLGAGAVSGLIALFGASVLVQMQTVVIDVSGKTGVPAIEARALFPAVPATHKTVDVFDPAPPAAPPSKPAAKPPVAATAPPPSPMPSPTHHRSPRPTPPPDN